MALSFLHYIRHIPESSDAPVRQRFHLVYAHEPVLGGVRFFQHVQVEVFVANFGATHTVEAGRTT